MLFTDLNFQGANVAGVLVVLAVSTVAFIGLGLMAAVLPVMSAERGAEATHIFQGSLLLVSGVYYPVEVLPRWILRAKLTKTEKLDSVRSVAS
jgi:ABC-2 type transport system permease protein